MGAMSIDDACVLVTGGTGSFGECFVRTLLDRHHPERLVVFSRDEFKQSELQQSLDGHPRHDCLRFFIGDVRDRDRLHLAMRGIDIVVHAAALKQIPAAEYNPFECIHTNVIGAENISNAAIQGGVKKVVALSTDKAANPLNLYGASKLGAEKIFVAANHYSGESGPRFSVVRYGNVMGSRGSVVPRFRELIANGADSLPITDERMTRFWITRQQGVDFVLSCLECMRGGEIFVPRIPSIRIVDLARVMAPNLLHRMTGIRPGEKLHEVMVTGDEARTTLALPDRYLIEPQFAWWSREPYTENGAMPVDEDFVYASNTNEEWLDNEQLQALIDGPC